MRQLSESETNIRRRSELVKCLAAMELEMLKQGIHGSFELRGVVRDGTLTKVETSIKREEVLK